MSASGRPEQLLLWETWCPINLRFQSSKGLPEHYSMHLLYHHKKTYKSPPVWGGSTQSLASNKRFTSRLSHKDYKDEVHSCISSNTSITQYYDRMMFASFNSHIPSQSFQEAFSWGNTSHLTRSSFYEEKLFLIYLEGWSKISCSRASLGFCETAALQRVSIQHWGNSGLRPLQF